MAKKFYWLKLKDNFFNQRAIKKLRKIAGGDTFVIIYLKMQLLSVKTEGKIEFEGTEENMLDQLELELDEDKANIELTIAYLMNNKLLELIDNDYLLTQACENIGKESDSAERVRKHRERKALPSNKKALPSNKKALPSNKKALPSNKCNATSNTEIEIEIEIEKEIEKKTYVNSKKLTVPYQEILDLYHETCKALPQVKTLNENRKKRLKAIYTKEAEQNIIWFKNLFEKVAQSDFLCGRTSDWSCGFDWIIKPANMIKILEDNYQNKKTGGQSNQFKNKVEQLNNFAERSTNEEDYKKFYS